MPPSQPYNPYNYTGSATDASVYNPYTSATNDIADVNHNPKAAGSAPGHWVTKDYLISWNLDMQMVGDSGISAVITNSNGDPDNTGDFVSLESSSSTPAYYGWSGVINHRIGPGEKQRYTEEIQLYQPKGKPRTPNSHEIHLKYWVADGLAPTSLLECPTMEAYLRSAYFLDSPVPSPGLSYKMRKFTLHIPKRFIDTINLNDVTISAETDSDGPELRFRNVGKTLAVVRCAIERAGNKPTPVSLLLYPGQDKEMEHALISSDGVNQLMCLTLVAQNTTLEKNDEATSDLIASVAGEWESDNVSYRVTVSGDGSQLLMVERVDIGFGQQVLECRMSGTPIVGAGDLKKISVVMRSSCSTISGVRYNGDLPDVITASWYVESDGKAKVLYLKATLGDDLVDLFTANFEK
ncbi:hypothetical protein [Tunturiibacter lichenicola]|uniref:hypothetical protein n=1 Tax=Tunturiibacter lichenicola TaxID=2051959 RepID=UPI0021B443AF|nr:hypothetical protein [Edaphobacter lichenicola]